MDSELFQRAFALGRLIAASVHREPYDHLEGESEHELSWAASGLAARLLDRAEWLLYPLSRGEAEALIGAERFAELQSRHLVRVVFKAVEVVSRSDLDERREPLDERDSVDLAKLREETWRENRPTLWIDEKIARSFVDAHRACHASTPPWEALTAPFVTQTRDGEPGYSIRVDRAADGWLWQVLPSASAKLWASMLTTDRLRDSELLVEWLARAGDRRLDAPTHLPSEPRERLLSAAVQVLKADPNLGDLESELQALQLDPARSPALPAFSTPASLHLFWKRLENYSRKGVYDETRSRLFGLVSLVVKYDASPKGGVPDRILELAEMGTEKPYLIYELALALQWSRPAAISWLLTRPSTAAFGQLLLGELKLQEPTMMDEWEHRAARIQARRVALMREALPAFVRATALGGARLEATSRPAVAVLEVLRGFARDCVRQSLFSEKQKELASAQAEELFSLVVANLTVAEPAYRIVSSSPEHVPRLLAECSDDLVTQLGPSFPPAERQEGLKVAHEVLRFLRENRPAFASRAPGAVDSLLRDVAATIAAWYIECLKLEDDANSFRYFSRPRALVALPWALTACTLQESGAVRPWLLLPPLRGKLIGAASVDAKEATELLAGASSRLRVHLEVVLGAYIECRNVLSASRTTRDAVGKLLEKTIEDLVLGRTDALTASVDLFDRTLVISSDDNSLARLVRLTVRVLTKFAPADGDRIIREWIEKTVDPVILLDLEKELLSPAHSRLVQEKLADPGTLERAEKDGWFTSLVDMASEAAAANHNELAERLLKSGDEVTANHPWRAQWERAAFRARLLIAYHRGDREEVLRLELPKSTIGERQAESEQRTTLERSRAFYVALLDLATNPEAARAAFASQLVDEPTSSALVVNLFAACLRVAKAIDDASARGQAYEDALRWWDGVRTSVPDQAGLEPHGTLNELLALDGAELDDEFDVRWFRLGEDVRARLELVALRLENLERRGLRDERTRLIDAARTRYGDALPSELQNVKTPEPVSVPQTHLTTEAYRNYWSEIRGLSPHELARVVGPTRGRELHDYLLHIHVNAAAEMLKRFSTVASLRSEDKLNDLIVSYVHMQIAVLDWSVHDQTRGGLSASGGGASTLAGGVGERDWVVQKQTREVCVCEALRLAAVDSAEIDVHVKKLVERYNPQGAPSSFVLVYYEGSRFNDFADRYKAYVETVSLSGWSLAVADGWLEVGSTRVKAFRAKALKDVAVVEQDHILVNVGPPAAAAEPIQSAAEAAVFTGT